MRKDLKFFHVGKISEIENPNPGLWSGFIGESRFVHNDDEFIAAKDTENQIVKFRWNSVECYDFKLNKIN